jgi:glucosamine-6-phosphate deaminase
MEESISMAVVEEKKKSLQVGAMRIEIYADRASMGFAAASAAAEVMKQLATTSDLVTGIFATGASQLDTLDPLTRMPGLPWEKTRGFHLDEYIGLPLDHVASFRGYLRKNLTNKVTMKEFNEIDGTAPDPNEVCREYSERLRRSDPQFCLLGIGENGHIAFNDPAVADFNDPLDVKVVELDGACKRQQVAEGWFGGLDEVPNHAISLTIPTLMRVPRLIVSVPGSRKAQVMRRTIEEAISTECPATILRTHPGVTVFLDEESAAELGALIS